jgi:hypothetical protein
MYKAGVPTSEEINKHEKKLAFSETMASGRITDTVKYHVEQLPKHQQQGFLEKLMNFLSGNITED